MAGSAPLSNMDMTLSCDQLNRVLVDVGLRAEDARTLLRECGCAASGGIRFDSFVSWLGVPVAAFAPPQRPPSAASGSPAERPANVWVPDMLYRGVTMGDLLNFFDESCGTTIFEDTVGEVGKPVCLPTKLAQKVVKWNQDHRDEIGAGKRRELGPNLYAVCDLLIKPMTEQHRVSASELWSREGKREGGCLIRNFVSHFWGEDFGEFVQSTFRYALHRSHQAQRGMTHDELVEEAKKMTFYICAFSNNQWNLKAELGDTVESSPFYRVLTEPTTERVVMNLDMCAAALSRAWCGFEFFLTYRLSKPFTINTRMGPLNEIPVEDKASEAWIVHMFSILQSVEIQKCQASRQSDLEMITREISTYKGTGVAEGKTGADALNAILKSQITQQVLPLLAKAGNKSDVQQALLAGALPNEPDGRGLKPVTVAAGKWTDQHPVVLCLLEARAHPDATIMAKQAVNMFEGETLADREKAIKEIRAALYPAKFYAAAVGNAEKELNAEKASLQAKQLEASEVSGRLHGLQNLQELPGNVAAQHVRKIVPLLGDDDAKVREAAVQALQHTGKPEIDVSGVHIGQEHLGDADDAGSTVWHAAARAGRGEAPGVALQILLAAGLDRALALRALAREDSWHRTPVHCAAEADAAASLEALKAFGASLDEKMGPSEAGVQQNQHLEQAKMPVALVRVDDGSEAEFVLARAVKRNCGDTWDFELERDGVLKSMVRLGDCHFAPTALELAKLMGCQQAAAALEKWAHSDPQGLDRIARLTSRAGFSGRGAHAAPTGCEGALVKKVVYIVDAGSTGCRLYRYTDLDFSGRLTGSEDGGGERRELVDASEVRRLMWVLCPARKPPAAEVLLLTDCLKQTSSSAMAVLAEVIEKAVKSDFDGLQIWPKPHKPCVVLIGTGGVRAQFGGSSSDATVALDKAFNAGLVEWRRMGTSGRTNHDAEVAITLERCEVITALEEARLEASAVRHALRSPQSKSLLGEFDPESVAGAFSIGGSSSQFTEFPSSCASIPVGFKAAQEVLESRGNKDYWAQASAADIEIAYSALKKSFDAVAAETKAKSNEAIWAKKFHGCWVALSSAAFAAGCVGLTSDKGCWQKFEPYKQLAKALTSPWSTASGVLETVQRQSLPILTATAEKDERVAIRDLAQVLTLRYLVETLFSPDSFLMFRRNWEGTKTNWPTGAAVEFFEGPERNLPLSVARDIFMLSVGDGQDVPGSIPSADKACGETVCECLRHIEKQSAVLGGLPPGAHSAAEALRRGLTEPGSARSASASPPGQGQELFPLVADYFEQLHKELGAQDFAKVAKEAIGHATALRAMDRFVQMDLYVNKLLQYDCLYVDLEKRGGLPRSELPGAAPSAGAAAPEELARLPEAERSHLEGLLCKAKDQLRRDLGEGSVMDCKEASGQLVLDGGKAVDRAAAIIQETCNVTKIVNSFSAKAVHLEGGYRDVRVSVRTASGLEVEVRLHLKEFFKLREDQLEADSPRGGKLPGVDADEEQLLGSLQSDIKKRMADIAGERDRIANSGLGGVEASSQESVEAVEARLRALCHHAGLRRVLDELPAAQKCYEEALEMIAKLEKLATRSQSMEVLSVYVKQRLVKVLRRQSEFGKAVELMGEVVTWLQERLGGSHGLVLEAKTTLSTMQAQTNEESQMRQAGALLNEVLPLLEEKHGRGDPKVLKALNGQAWLELQLGNVGKASRLFKDVYELRKQAHGSRHLETFSACHNAGLAAAAENDLRCAVQLFREAFAGRAGLLPPNDSKVLASKHSLGLLLAGEADDEASKLLQNLKAEKGWAKTSVARVLDEKGCVTALVRVLERAWSFLRLRLGHENPAVAKIAEGLDKGHARLLKSSKGQGGEEEAWRLLLAGEVKLRMLRADVEEPAREGRSRSASPPRSSPASAEAPPRPRPASLQTAVEASATLRQVNERVQQLELEK